MGRISSTSNRKSALREARRVGALVGSLRTIMAMGVVMLAAASPVLAHGPTIEITHQALKSALLNLHVGTTVHFSNTVEMPGGHVIVDEGGMLESPPLEAPGDGWHYTFEEAGTYELFIREHPKARGRVVIFPK